MGAIGEVLGEAVTPEVGGAWSEAVLFLAKVRTNPTPKAPELEPITLAWLEPCLWPLLSC